MVSNSDPDEIKQVLLIRMDLAMGKGKLAAQAAHASLDSYRKAESKTPGIVREWIDSGMPKVALKIKDEGELLKYFMLAKEEGLPCALIIDAGRTQLEPGSKTCVGIGPAPSGIIDQITGKLPLL